MEKNRLHYPERLTRAGAPFARASCGKVGARGSTSFDGRRYIQTVTGMSGDLLSGLPDAVRRLLGAPSAMEKKPLHAFGPVDLDRSPVELSTAAQPHLGCPACAGRRLDFPADLDDARERMCPAHRKEAGAVIRTRLNRANARNPSGWAALTDASARLSLPHLPNGLATKLAGADQAMYVALGDVDGAAAHFRAALAMAEQADDFEARYEAVDRLGQIALRRIPR